MDINHLIARRIKALREARSLALDALASLSGVSRSNISLIERGQSSASATVLYKLAAALDVPLSSLFEGEDAQAPSPLSRATEQLAWTDPVSGYTRRTVSPAAPSSLELVDVVFPPGQRVVYEPVARNAALNQQIWLLDGVMEITVGEQHWRLEAGDCLAVRLDRILIYVNPGPAPAHYLVALATVPHPPIKVIE